MSRIVRFHKTGGPEVLAIENSDVAPPGPGEVRIDVKALGLNRAESMFRSGMYLEDPKLPARLGYEAAGIVAALGAGVTDFRVGDAVSTIPAFSQNQHGVYGEVATVPAFAVVKHPPALSWVDAAAIWMQYATAYGALIDIAQIKPGDAVVIPAASSSVGIAAIQICNMIGAVSIALTRGNSKRDKLIELGAKYVIATQQQDVVAEILKITAGKGARVAFDPVGGLMVEKLTAAMAQHGILILYGALATEPTPLPLFTVLAKLITVRGYVLFEMTSDPARLGKAKAFIVDGLANGKLKPVIAKTFPFEQIVEAHRYMESNEQIGKIVVTI